MAASCSTHVFPRPTSRGLIEATCSGMAFATMPGCFRGQPAAASLKQRQVAPRVVKGPAFPRPTSRGLIEARKCLSMLAKPQPFPRPTSRGLIEACSWALVFRLQPCFRGQPAAASLKLQRGGLRARDQ